MTPQRVMHFPDEQSGLLSSTGFVHFLAHVFGLMLVGKSYSNKPTYLYNVIKLVNLSGSSISR